MELLDILTWSAIAVLSILILIAHRWIKRGCALDAEDEIRRIESLDRVGRFSEPITRHQPLRTWSREWY